MSKTKTKAIDTAGLESFFDKLHDDANAFIKKQRQQIATTVKRIIDAGGAITPYDSTLSEIADDLGFIESNLDRTADELIQDGSLSIKDATDTIAYTLYDYDEDKGELDYRGGCGLVVLTAKDLKNIRDEYKRLTQSKAKLHTKGRTK